jgi:hypothetical protein
MPESGSRPCGKGETLASTVLLTSTLLIGLATVRDYGITVDEFLYDDYGPKALAWYASGGTDTSLYYHYDNWLYGPWFQMLTASVQLLDLTDRFDVRHAMTFLIGIAGLAALVPIGRIVVGPWAGFAALALCLLTGNLYGHLFFTPNDVPFLAAMTWALLAVVAMARREMPTWPTTIAAGLLCGLAIATRVGGILSQVYLIAAMALLTIDIVLLRGHASLSTLSKIGLRVAVALTLGWLLAIALWPFLQADNPLQRFMAAYDHFGTLKLEMTIPYWGHPISTTDLPWSYIPGELAARLPEVFVILLIAAPMFGLAQAARLAQQGRAGASGILLSVARARGILVVAMAALAPIVFVILTRASLYDGVRHILFTLPPLAVLAAWSLSRCFPLIRRFPLPFAAVAAAQIGAVLFVLVRLHPLEYIATNAFAGWTPGSYGRFELDYLNVAATPALRRLEKRRRDETAGEAAPQLMICIPWREHMIAPMFRQPWRVETNPRDADFIIETERYRCARDTQDTLIDQVMRFDKPFAWTFRRRVDTGN